MRFSELRFCFLSVSVLLILRFFAPSKDFRATAVFGYGYLPATEPSGAEAPAPRRLRGLRRPRCAPIFWFCFSQWLRGSVVRLLWFAAVLRFASAANILL